MKCPKCGDRTDVLETQPSRGRTRRRRRCLSPHCGHRFTTFEAAQAELDAIGEQTATRKIARLGTGRAGAVLDPEALAAALAVDRRKAEFREQQRRKRDLEEYEGEDVPITLTREGARRLIRGY